MRVKPAALLLLGAACGSRSTLVGESFVDDPYATSGSSGGSGDGGGVDGGAMTRDAGMVPPPDVGTREEPDATVGDASAPDASRSGDAPPSCDGPCTVVSFASGPDWEAYAGSVSASPPAFMITAELGLAVDVCLTADSPPGCPSHALLWNFGPAAGGPTWTGGAGLTGAWWIWRPDVKASSPAAFAVAIFQSTFVVGPLPTGTLKVSADDLAVVFVNDTAIGSIGSLTDLDAASSAHSVATTFDLTPGLHAGANIITVAAENGPFNCPNDACPYSEDPAGVVFDGTLRW
jgi:hypothetical protein